MKFLEKDLEDMIWNAIMAGETNELAERGFPFFNAGKFFRQYNFGEGFGVADLMCVSLSSEKVDDVRAFELTATIYELKRDTIGWDAFDQAIRYTRAMQAIMDDLQSENTVFLRPKINICLIGRNVDLNSSFCYLSDVFDNVYLYTYNFHAFYGVTFHHKSGYLPTTNKHPNFTASRQDIMNMLHFNMMVKANKRCKERKQNKLCPQ